MSVLCVLHPIWGFTCLFPTILNLFLFFLLVTSACLFCCWFSGERPRRPPRAPEHFSSDFPSLEEQEKMTRRERDELERRRRDESRRFNQDRAGSQSPSTDWSQYPKYPEPVWDHQPPPNYAPPPGHAHGYPPTGPGRGYPPPPAHPHSHHPTQHHPPFFAPPPRQGNGFLGRSNSRVLFAD